MSHPDPLFDPDNCHEDDEMVSGMDENWDVDETEYETYDDEDDSYWDGYDEVDEEDDDPPEYPGLDDQHDY